VSYLFFSFPEYKQNSYRKRKPENSNKSNNKKKEKENFLFLFRVSFSSRNLIQILKNKRKSEMKINIFCLDIVEPMLHQSQYMYISRISHQRQKISFAKIKK
jgi:hypothetical protein